MPRRNVASEHIRNIQQSRGCYSVSIPIKLMREFGWRERQKLVVKKHGKGKLLIEDWKS